MTPQTILDLTRDALLIVMWVVLPVVAVATVTSLVVAVLQAVTQIQDQSIGQSVRLIAVLFTIVICGAWLSRSVMGFAERALKTIGTL